MSIESKGHNSLEKEAVLKDVKVKDSENKFFTVEFFGVALIVATFLLLVALLFGKNVLFELGAEVQAFLYGFSGYFSYPLLIALNYVGFMMVLGKKIQKSSTKTNVKFALLFLFSLLCMLTVISGAKTATSYGEYLKYAFSAGRQGLNSAVAGGWLFSLITYPFVKIIKYVGAIIFFALLTVLIVVLYVVKRKKGAVKTAGVRVYPGKLPGEAEQGDSASPAANAVGSNVNSANADAVIGVIPSQSAYNQNAYNQNGYDPFSRYAPSGAPVRNDQNSTGNGFGAQNFGGGHSQNQGGYNQSGYNQGYQGGYVDNRGGYHQTQNQNAYGGYGDNKFDNRGGYNGANASGGGYGYENGGFTEENPRFVSVDGQRKYGNDEKFDENMRTIYGKPVTYSEVYRSDFDPQKNIDSFGASEKTEQSGGVSAPIDKKPYGDDGADFGGEYSDNFEKPYSSKEEAFEDIDNSSDGDFEDPFAPIEEEKPKIDVKKFFESRTKKEASVLSGKPYSDDDDNLTDSGSSGGSSKGGSAFTAPSVPETNDDDGRNMIEKMPVDYKYTAPPISLLKSVDTRESDAKYEEYRRTIVSRILSTLARFGVETKIAQSFRGPAVSRFDIEVPEAVPMKKITQLYDDLNLRVKAASAIRMIAPVPNTDYVGIEVPNEKPDAVALKELIASPYFDTSKPSSLNFILGKDIVGKPVCLDLAEMPHVLVSGTTGSGKSVCINSMIASLIFRYSPAELRFIIVDPKKVDFVSYQNLPHMLFNEIIEDVPVVNAMLTWAVNEMNERYRILREKGVKKLSEYNAKAAARGERLMPRLVIIIDEFADLMKQDQRGIGDKICMLAQKSRASGIHLVLVAQRPSADIVEGPIKSNLPARLVFKAASRTDSAVSLGASGAETLVGRGDCLYKTATMLNIERAMGAYISDDEVDEVVGYVEKHNVAYYDYNAWSKIMSTVASNMQQDDKARTDLVSAGGGSVGAPHSDADELWIKAMRECYREGGVSGSFLVRRLSIGSNRAARMVDWLIDNGYLSAKAEGGKRKPLYTQEEFERMIAEKENGED